MYTRKRPRKFDSDGKNRPKPYFSERITLLIKEGKVRYYKSLGDFKNRKTT